MKPKNIFFEDAESSLITALNIEIAKHVTAYTILTGVRVATKRMPSQATQVAKEVIISATGSQTVENGLSREQGFNINIFTTTYVDGKTLAPVIEACLNNIRGNGFRWVETDMSIIEVEDDSETQVWHLLTVTGSVAAIDFL